MATSERYLGRMRLYNADPLYKKMFEDRGVTRVLQYATPELRYPTVEEIGDLHTVSHEWKLGDRYWKLANKYYGDPKLWWVIARFNMRPTESHFKGGDVIYIPFPVDRLLDYYGV